MLKPGLTWKKLPPDGFGVELGVTIKHVLTNLVHAVVAVLREGPNRPPR